MTASSSPPPPSPAPLASSLAALEQLAARLASPPRLPPLEALERAARQRLGTPARPPGPPMAIMGLSMLGLMHDLRAFVEHLATTYGDAVYMRVGGLQFYVLTDPQQLDEVLISKSQKFHKDPFLQEIKELLGEGLLTSEDPLWRKQRKLAAPPLQRRQITSYAEKMSAATHTLSARLAPGKRIDLWGEMTEVTLQIVVETLFGLPNSPRASEVSEALEEALDYYDQRQNTLWSLLPRQIETPLRPGFERALHKLNAIVDQMIAERRAGEPGDDLLWRLMEARYEDGEAMSARQLRDEVLTIFLAGHETTALVTMYAFEALARSPHVARSLHEELDAHRVAGGTFAADQLRQLPYLEAVVKEVLRLYPPAWMVSRQATEAVQIGPWELPAGAIVMMPPWVLHRDARYFDDPLEFRPERWIGTQLEKQLPRHVYMPFGGGPRVCIGNHFAMMEIMIVVGELAAEWEFELVDPTPHGYDAFVTLRPDRPIEAIAHPRHATDERGGSGSRGPASEPFRNARR